jgi:hypothetical protein
MPSPSVLILILTAVIALGPLRGQNTPVSVIQVQEILKPSRIVIQGATFRYQIKLRHGEPGRMVVRTSIVDSIGAFKVLRNGEFRGTFREGAISGEEVGYDFDLRAEGTGWVEIPWPPMTVEVPGVGGPVFAIPARPRILVLPRAALSATVAFSGMLLMVFMGVRLKKRRQRRLEAEEIEYKEKREKRLRTLRGGNHG